MMRSGTRYGIEGDDTVAVDQGVGPLLNERASDDAALFLVPLIALAAKGGAQRLLRLGIPPCADLRGGRDRSGRRDA